MSLAGDNTGFEVIGTKADALESVPEQSSGWKVSKVKLSSLLWAKGL